MKYDIIGDIHGHHDALIKLLQKLGYQEIDGYYQHPEGRKVMFLGDFIDRGPKIRETLQVVKAMWDNGTAEAVMGNHEYNAICFYLKDKTEGGYLRPHNFKNIKQHFTTINQFADFEDEWKIYVEWFMQLPLFIEKENFRVVHACWDDELIAHLKMITVNNILPKTVFYESQQAGTKNFEAIERTLKGKETTLPDNMFFLDKDGHKRTEVRTRWWKNADEIDYNQYFMEHQPELEGKKIPKGEIRNNNYYENDNLPLFFGHYWMDGETSLQSHNLVCLDYSIAKGGKLVAYHYNGEKELKHESLIF